MTSNGFDTYFISKCDRLSIHSSLPFGPRHHAIPQNQHNRFLAERKKIADRRLFCRIHLKKPSFRRTDSSPSWTHNSDSFPYQILVLTAATTGGGGDDALPEPALEVVIRSPEIQDAEPIRSAPMTEAATSSRGGIELLVDDLVDPATVARHLEAVRQAEQWMKVGSHDP
jgi:hypothetical protein